MGDISPQTVHHAQRGIAVRNFGHQYADRANIVNLRKTNAFALHFPPDTVNVLGTACYLDFKVNLAQLPQ